MRAVREGFDDVVGNAEESQALGDGPPGAVALGEGVCEALGNGLPGAVALGEGVCEAKGEGRRVGTYRATARLPEGAHPSLEPISLARSERMSLALSVVVCAADGAWLPVHEGRMEAESVGLVRGRGAAADGYEAMRPASAEAHADALRQPQRAVMAEALFEQRSGLGGRGARRGGHAEALGQRCGEDRRS